jgi:hypothetical protein
LSGTAGFGAAFFSSFATGSGVSGAAGFAFGSSSQTARAATGTAAASPIQSRDDFPPAVAAAAGAFRPVIGSPLK